MLKFVSGDFFDYEADIRVNTVNCVGVMGAGVALLFKTKYPDMYKQYVKDCKNGLIKPGAPTIWSEGDMFSKQTHIINFPTKDHWRNNSEYCYVEDGLKWMQSYLKDVQGKTITLPALGCGHGGLDWNIVKSMIETHLSDSNNEILVFEPASSKNVKVKEIYKDFVNLEKIGIKFIGLNESNYPEFLRPYFEKDIFVFNKENLNKKYDYSLISSSKPENEEIELVKKILFNNSGSFIFGGTKYDLYNANQKQKVGGQSSIFLPSGIANFIEKNSNKFNLEKLEICSFGDPWVSFDKSQFISSAIARMIYSKNALITCANINWLISKKNIDIIVKQNIQIYFADYLGDGVENRLFFEAVQAKPISHIIE